MKQIIIIETNPADGGMLSIKCVFWFAVPAGRRIPRPDISVSVFADASAAEVDALKSGAVFEEVQVLRLPSSFTATQIKAALVAAHTDRQTYLSSLPFRGQYYGVYYDGTVWSA